MINSNGTVDPINRIGSLSFISGGSQISKDASSFIKGDAEKCHHIQGHAKLESPATVKAEVGIAII